MPRGPWCPKHKCHPNECFEIHYPESTRGTPVDYDAIVRDQVERQNEAIRREKEKMNRNIVDARKRFDESRKKRDAS